MHSESTERPARRAAMEHDKTVAELVQAAQSGDFEAWNDLVRQFLPLVRAVINRVRLSPADAADVNQTVWLRLVEHLDDLRDPRALPGWLATTARREALRSIEAKKRVTPIDPQDSGIERIESPGEVDDLILKAERAQAVRDGLAELPAGRRQLLELLVAEPPLSYEEISRTLGIPIGSIGPTRARALAQLRNTKAMRAWSGDTDAASAAGGDGSHAHVR
jgi:RNA polymerase sigma factor (sigma-70 family)